MSTKLLVNSFLPSNAIVILLVSLFVGYIFIFSKPVWHQAVFIHSEMFQIDAPGYSILFIVDGEIGRY